jgi:hypothetical protein
VPSRVVPEVVGVKVNTLVPWQNPLIGPDIVPPPTIYLLKAAFKFKAGPDFGELSPPPHAANMTTDKRGKASFNFVLLNIVEAVVLNIMLLILLFFYLHI